MSSSADGLRDDGEGVSKSAKKAQAQMRGISVRVPKEIHDAIFLRKIITGKTITEIVEQTLMRELEADIASLRMLSRGDGDVRHLDAEERR